MPAVSGVQLEESLLFGGASSDVIQSTKVWRARRWRPACGKTK